MALAIPAQWTGAGGVADVHVPAQPVEGSWLVAAIAYRVVDGTEPLASVGDMGRNWWLLCGSAHNPDSGTRVEVWACPTVVFAGFPLAVVYSAVSHIHADDTGSHVVHVAEVTGMVNGFPTLLSATVGTATGTSLAIDLPDPGQNALVVAAAAADNNAVAVTAPSSPWTALTAVSRDDPDLGMSPVWQATDTAGTATWTAPSPLIWTGIVVALAETGTVWEQPNQHWPATRLELGAGFGQHTPLPRVDWVDHTARFESLVASRGIGYELGRPQAGEAQLTVYNDDQAVISEAGGDYDLYTPYRLLMAWDGKIYPVSAGWVEQFRRRWLTPAHEVADGDGIDALATLVQEVPSALRGEILHQLPYAYWPLDDAAGSQAAINVSPRSSAPLEVTASKYGVGAAVENDFGALLDLEGDPSGTGWQLHGMTADDEGRGYALVGRDDNFPPISGGITLVGWSNIDVDLNNQPAGEDLTLVILRSRDARNGTVIKLAMNWSDGSSAPAVTVWDKDTAAFTKHEGEFGLAQGRTRPWALRFTRTAFEAFFVDASAAEISGSCDLPGTFHLIDVGGEADWIFTGNFGNATHGHVAVFDRLLSDAELNRIMVDAAEGFPGDISILADPPGELTVDRMQRFFAYAGSAAPRALDSGSTYGGQDGAGGILLQRVTDLTDQEAGLLYGDGAGYVRFRTSRGTYQQAPRWTLGDDTASGEIPFQSGATVTTGPTYLHNRVQVTSQGEFGATRWTTRVHLASDAASAQRYGLRPLDRTVSLYRAGDAQLLAEWLLERYRLPRPRWSQVTVDAAAYPQAWPLVLGVEVGDLVDVVRRPVGSAAATVACQVMQVRHQIRGRRGDTTGRVTLVLAAAPPPVLLVGDPDRGRLGDNTIGWH